MKDAFKADLYLKTMVKAAEEAAGLEKIHLVIKCGLLIRPNRNLIKERVFQPFRLRESRFTIPLWVAKKLKYR